MYIHICSSVYMFRGTGGTCACKRWHVRVCGGYQVELCHKSAFIAILQSTREIDLYFENFFLIISKRWLDARCCEVIG